MNSQPAGINAPPPAIFDRTRHRPLALGILVFGAVLILSFWLSQRNHLLFHSLVGIFSIVIAYTIFVLAWNTRLILDNNYLLFVGIAYLFIGFLDTIHTFSCPGMKIFPGGNANIADQLWIGTHYLEGVALLAAPLFLNRRLRAGWSFAGFTAAVLALIASIFWRPVFPDAFHPEAGPTAFKVASEFVIALLFLGAVALLWRERRHFEPSVHRLLTASILVMIAAELIFSFSHHAEEPASLIGHYLTVVSGYLIYKALVETGLACPYNLLFRDLKKSEEALRRSRDFVQSVIDSIGDPTLVIDAADYRIVLANRAARALTGGMDPAAAGLKCHEASHRRDSPCDTPHDPCPLKEVRETGAPARVTHLHFGADGRPLYIEIVATPIRGERGEVVQIIESNRDVTAQRLAEEALRESRNFTQSVLDSIGDPTLVIDPADHRILLANQAARALAGNVDLAALGWTCHRASHGRDFPCDTPHDPCPLQTVLATGTRTRVTHIHQAPERGECFVDILATPVLGERGEVLRVIESSRDITDMKRAEASIQEYARRLEASNRLKDLFTDILGHDLMNPMIATHYSLESLQGAEPSPLQVKTLELIRENTKRVIDLVRMATRYSHLESVEQLERQPLDLAALLRDSLAVQTEELRRRDIAVELRAAGRCLADVNPLVEHVFENLLSNAVKFSPIGGRIAVEIAAEDGCWVVSVTDFGPGIPDGSKVKVFTRWERLQKEGVKGHGLGLAIAKRIVDLHGGRIWVEDNPEGGAVFRVALRQAGAVLPDRSATALLSEP